MRDAYSQFTDWLSYLCLGAVVVLLIVLTVVQVTDCVSDAIRTEDEICNDYPEWLECA